MYKIKKIIARQIIDSRATPTIEVDLYLNDGSLGRAAIPSGASTGIHEALELRDSDKSKFQGKGVLKAVNNVNNLSEVLSNKEFNTQEDLDKFLIELDGTSNKSKLGANAILGISLGFAKAVANQNKTPLYRYINEIYGNELKLPRPMFNIMNGGKHANWSTDIQEFMIIIKDKDYSEMLRASCEIFFSLEKILKDKNMSTNVGNEGGFAPGFNSNEEALITLLEAIEKAGYKAGEDVFLGLDIASSEFYSVDEEKYILKKENKKLNSEQWSSLIENWINKYPLISIEDPFSEDDWLSWNKFTSKFSNTLQIVGDDLLVTNTQRVKKAIDENSCNSLLVKVNQIGSLTEALNAMHISQKAGWTNIVSHRSGETEDTTIAHIAVGTGCGQIKTGAPSRGERTAKYNELLRIEEELK